jgi:excisionase family DNA binding protein
MAKVKRATRPRVPQTAEAVTLTPKESRRITRFGANYTYKLLHDGTMPSIKVGARFFIPKNALLRWLDSCADTKPAA